VLAVEVVMLEVPSIYMVLATERLPALMLVAPNPKRLPTAAAKLTAPEPDDIVKPLTDEVALLSEPSNVRLELVVVMLVTTTRLTSPE
jgi:hypothetical protein